MTVKTQYEILYVKPVPLFYQIVYRYLESPSTGSQNEAWALPKEKVQR